MDPSQASGGDTPSDLDAETAPGIAMRNADTHRAVRGYAGAAAICALGIAGLHVADGIRSLYWLAIVCIASAGLFTAWLAYDRYGGGLYSEREVMTALMLMCAAALSAVAYVGPISATAVVLVILVAGMAMGNEPRGRLVLAIITGGYGCIGALSVAGVIPALVELPAFRQWPAIATLLLTVELVLLVSYWFGFAARRSTQAALNSVQQARLQLAGRDLQLQEARADLDRVARGQRRGRLSNRIVAGYHLHEIIGYGGMGEVYAATHEQHDGAIAFKVLHANLINEADMVERFFREAQICSELSSEHVARVFGYGEGPDGSPFLAMDRIRGLTLAEILRTEDNLGLSDAEQLVIQVARGLSAAHDAGVIHRDVKPTNVMRLDTPPHHWKLLDFGISKLQGHGTLTGNAMLGTPGYMAPEQSAGSEVDSRADVFALAAVTYRALTGVPPFNGPNAMAIVLNAAQRQPVSPCAVANLPEDVDSLLALGLAKDRDERIASAAAFAEAFSAACRSELNGDLRRRAHELLRCHPWTDPLAVVPRSDGPDGRTLAL